MIRFRDRPIQRKLHLAILLVAGLVLSVAALVFLSLDVYQARQGMVQRFTSLSNILARELAPTLAFRDPSSARNTLGNLAGERQVLRADAYTLEGRPFAAYLLDRALDQGMPLEAPAASGTCPDAHFELKTLTICALVSLEGEALGRVQLHISLAPLYERLGLDFLVFTLGLMAALLLATVIAKRLAKLLAQPVLELSGVMGRVSARHDYSLRARKLGEDELGALTDGFNAMLAQVERQNAAMKDYNTELEQRVAERTSDLLVTVEELKLAKELAEQGSRAKSEFLSSMSHELRTPMNSILGFAQLLQIDQSLSQDHQEGVSEILKAGRHLLELINEVLDLSRIEAGRLSISLESVDLEELTRECVTLMENSAEREQISLGRELQDCVGRHVRADRLRLKQVLLNLLSNAIKYNRTEGEVRLYCRPADPGRIRLEVSDTGPGIPQDKLSHLFTPFNRLGREAGTVEGTGIGLVISKRLIEMMGGSIGVVSEPGQGCTFWVEVGEDALNTAPAPVPAELEQALHPPAGAGHHTLVYVEDNPANQRLMAEMLRPRSDLHLTVCGDPLEALALIRSAPPDLILLDINLPGMDGHEVLRRLRADPATRAIPIIAVTANAMPQEVARGLAGGFDAYLTKPLVLSECLRTLDRQLYRNRLDVVT